MCDDAFGKVWSHNLSLLPACTLQSVAAKVSTAALPLLAPMHPEVSLKAELCVASGPHHD
jgi:hypothetical protein